MTYRPIDRTRTRYLGALVVCEKGCTRSETFRRWHPLSWLLMVLASVVSLAQYGVSDLREIHDHWSRFLTGRPQY